MLFIIQFEDIYADQPGRLPERAHHMAAHLAFLARHGDQVIAAGALRPAEGATPDGGVWIVNAPSKAEAEALLYQDPFWIAGLRKSVRVSHWAKAFWSAPFVACMEASRIG
jgi:uncharacterized protein YciI